MEIKTKFSEKDYINLNFFVQYRRFTMRFLTAIGLIALIGAVVTKLMAYPFQTSTQFVIAGVALILFPVLVYFSAKRNYKNDKRVSETIVYKFRENKLEIIGESFENQVNWNGIYKITKTSNWILIWHSKQIINGISKKYFEANEILALKELLDKNKVKNNL